jgi:hypothetical protein
MKKLKNKILQIITAVYFIFYFQGFALPFFTGEMTFSNAESITTFLMFLLFSVGFIVSWFSNRFGGILLQAWYALIWLFAYTCWHDAGMVIFLGVPILIIGVLLSLKSYKESVEPNHSRQLLWKYTLRQLLYNYAVIYVIIVIGEISKDKLYAEFSFQNLLFLLLLILFVAGFIASGKNYLVAGLLFIAWYAVVLLGNFASYDFSQSGPWFVIGLSVLAQGIIYVGQYFKQNR